MTKEAYPWSRRYCCGSHTWNTDPGLFGVCMPNYFNFTAFLGSDDRSDRLLVLLLDVESDNLTVSGFTREQQLMQTTSRYKPMMSSVPDMNW